VGGICDGPRVVDFSTWMAGPLATMVLADYGAEVIKVEPRSGDPARSLPAFQTWNRGKLSVVADLKTAGGRAKALELIAGSDVVVTSWRPGVAERLGVGYEDVRPTNRALVYAAITGFGERGSRKSNKGYEGLVAAKSGRMMMFEQVADRPGPAFPAIPCASYSAGMLTLQGILTALHRRERTGEGQRVSISMLAALMPFDLVMWIGWQLRGEEIAAEGQPAPMVLQTLLGQRLAPGDAKAGAYDPAQPHRPAARVPRPNYLTAVTKDGVWLQFANTIDRLCLAQMQALDLMDMYGEERFARMPAVFTEDDAEALWEAVLQRVRAKTYDEWTQVFEQYDDLAVEVISLPLQSLEHRQVKHNGHSIAVSGDGGMAILQPGPLVTFAGDGGCAIRRAPRLGEHTEALAIGSGRRSGRAIGSRSTNGPAALSGITILDFSAWVAAPYATTLLATLGARVIKVEPVGGDMSRYSTGGLVAFAMTQGKQSIALDLKQPEGTEIAHRLVQGADMLVHNFRPGVTEKLGIDYATCHRLNPRLIYLNAASYGESGPDARKPAFFATMAALGGNQMRQVGTGHPSPNSAELPMDDLKDEAWRLLKAAEGNADPIAALGAATALLLGLYARDKNGKGQALLTTMEASNMYANSDEAIDYVGRPASTAVDSELLGLSPLYRLYAAETGWVFLACVQPHEWEAFCDAIERQDMKPRRADEAASRLGRDVAQVLATRPAEEWETLASARDVPLVAVELRDPGRFNLEDAEQREFGHMVEVESPVHGRYWRHGVMQEFSRDRLEFGPWEPLGGHTREILGELGWSGSETDSLIERGVVEAWSPQAIQRNAR